MNLVVFVFLNLISASPQRQVNPDVSPVAVKLLEYIYEFFGMKILIGQLCTPLIVSNRLSLTCRISGHHPALFRQDFGFNYYGNRDGFDYLKIQYPDSKLGRLFNTQ